MPRSSRNLRVWEDRKQRKIRKRKVEEQEISSLSSEGEEPSQR